MGPVMVEVEDLTVRYGNRTALNGVGFAIGQGELFGLLGPNGAGKTTLVSVLSTLLKPTSGSVAVGSMDVVREAEGVKQIIGVVPQEIALYPTLSARENLGFYGRIYGLRGAKLRYRIEELLEVVGLGDRGRDPVQKFSGGMKRRLNLAVGLLHKPRLLLLDEPMVGVDPQSRNHIFESIRTLKSEGVTMVYTTHYMEEAERLCDRVAIIDEGRLLALDSPQLLIERLGDGLIHVGVGFVDERLVNTLGTLPRVREVRCLGPRGSGRDEGEQPGPSLITIRTDQVKQALAEVIGVFDRLEVRVSSLEVLEPNLNSVFLELTGKRLRK
jgi:ABC-2 type transport system ATP-binding protein